MVERPPSPSPTVSILDKPIRMELVRIPAGEFLMGSDPTTDKDAYDDEGPQHAVYLSDFYIARTPVTNTQFAVFSEAQGYQTTAEREGFGWVWVGSKWERVKGANWRNPGGPETDIAGKEEHPVVQVSWHDAVAFCSWLSEVTGRPFRLPTEAEWEKAARGSTTGTGRGHLYPWGDALPSDKLCNFNTRVGSTTPVDAYLQGATPDTGMLDLAGNVWEWLADWYDADFYTNSPARNPVGPTSGQYRVLRGGSWNNSQRNIRAAVRYRRYPDLRNSNIGFRCACA